MEVAPQTQGLAEREFPSGGTLQPALWERAVIISSRLLSIAIQLFQAHMLGVREFSICIFVQWLALLSVPALGTGISTLASQRIAYLQSRETPRQISGIFYFLWYRQHWQVIRYCIGYAALAFSFAWLFPAYPLVFLLLAGLAMLPLQLSTVVGTILRGLRRTDLLALLDLFGAVLTLLLMLLIAQVSGEPLKMFLLVGGLASTITLIMGTMSIKRLLPLEQAYRPGVFLRERLQKSFKQPWLLFLFDAVIWQGGELVLLAYWTGPTLTGLYALSAFISSSFMGLAPTFFSSWTFSFRRNRRLQTGQLGTCGAFVRTTCGIALLAIPCCLALIGLAPILVPYCLGNAYQPMILPFQILLIPATLGSIATFGMTYLAQREGPGMLLWLNGGAALLKIGLSVPLIISWGIIGAAVASAVVQSAVAVAAMFFCFLRLRN